MRKPPLKCNNHRQSVFLTIIEIGQHGKEFAVDFLCELDMMYSIHKCMYFTCLVLWCTPFKRWWYIKPILRVPLSKNLNMSCFSDLIPGEQVPGSLPRPCGAPQRSPSS